MTDAARSSTVKVFAVPHCPEARPWPVSGIRLLDQPRAQFAIVLLAVPEQFEERRALLRGLARSRWALLRALLPTLLRIGSIRLPTERDGIDAAAFAQPQRRLGCVALAAELDHDVDGAASASPGIADVPDAPIRHAARVNRQILVVLAPERFRLDPPGASVRLVDGGAAENIRHPGAEVLKGNVVDLAPELLAVVRRRR